MKYQLLKISLICVLIGILTGILSSSLVYSYLLPFMDANNIFIKKQDALPQSINNETQNNVLNSVVVFYKAKTASGEFLRNIFLEKDRIGYGFVVTSDGWVVADKNILMFGTKQIAVALSNGNMAEITKIERDLKNGLVFARLSATGLHPISFGNPRDIALGENLYIFDESQKVSKIYFGGIGYKSSVSETSIINSSENFGKVLFFGEAIDTDFNGLPIFNYRGDVVGAAKGDAINAKTAIPIDYVEKSLQSLFRYGKIMQPLLGIKYLDLAHLASVDETVNKRGALILSADKERTDLKTGDIVLRINSDELNREYNLSEIISDYQIGAELEFTVLREGKEQKIKVKMME